MVLAGYSQGGIALRAALSRLKGEPAVWSRFAQVDLFGDGSASKAADSGMPVGQTPLVRFPARRSTMGIWLYGRNATSGARTPLVRLIARIFKAENLQSIGSLQAPASYPAGLKPRVDRYCNVRDLVCDTRAAVDGFIAAADGIGCTLNEIGVAACATERGWFKAQVSYVLSQHAAYKWKPAALDTAGAFPPRPAPPAIPNMSNPFTSIGAYGDIVQRPDQIYFSGAGSCNPYFFNLTWNEWGPSRAVATGTGRFIVAVPTSCAAAIRSDAPTTVTMSEPMNCRGSGLVFTRMSWVSTVETGSFSAARYCEAP